VRSSSFLLLAAGPVLAASPFLSGAVELQVAATNRLDLARTSETIEVPASALSRWIAPQDLQKVAVVDAAGRTVLSQAVDEDGDGTFDRLVFQADFAPGERKTLRLLPGKREPYRREDFRVYGRFVRERFDDFAWENDRIAHRMYGPALETWEREPLTSSTVDVWTKRTRRLVVNDWYMVDNYHRDLGEGADLYSAGKSRGCGGSGVVFDGRLFVSRNFRSSRVLAQGPIRLVFELTYASWDAGGATVAETKRVTLDAGSNLNRFESVYTVPGRPSVAWAAGIRKVPGAAVRTWEPMGGPNGHLGCAVLADPASVATVTEAGGNVLLFAKDGARAVYWAGFGWDRSGDFASVADWDLYLEQMARRLRSPIDIVVEENPKP
jgi:Domain of unknown function (DUF4861)